MKKVVLSAVLISTFAFSTQAQILLSGGLSYSQSFDSLPSTGTSGTWTDNSTLPGWYASKIPGGVPTTYSVFRIDNGANNSGSLFDYGTTGASDRSLGSLTSGTPLNNAIGVLFKNDTGAAATYDISISYTGEEWRLGGNASVQTNLAFDYTLSSSDLSASILSPVTNNPAFTGVASLNFVTPTGGATAAALDGNASANRTALTGTLTSITLNAGDEIMLRWVDINDAGNDDGSSIDDFSINFTPSIAPEPTTAALGGLGALALIFARRNRKNH
ncbi:MAG TPA: PEP-CTERM sorting domain-containing protein [Verrucomicrobiae bacterium]|nr:PEP-CTERM sorting domain-containing protein [Verrucomicrobiae bacterium]